MRSLSWILLFLLIGCSMDTSSNDPYKQQNSIVLSQVDKKLLDFQSTSAVAEWTPVAMKEIQKKVNNLIKTIVITEKIESYNYEKSRNLLAGYKEITLIIPISDESKKNNLILIQIGDEYYSACGNQELIEDIKNWSRMNHIIPN